MTTPPSPRLYLDIDGVILADNPRFREVKEFALTRYAPEVPRRLGATGLELVLLTDWGARESSRFIQELGHFGTHRLLERPGYSNDWKLPALIEDQLNSPAPFVWADDQITAANVNQLNEDLSVPQLVISPDPTYGLNKSHLAHIEAFAQNYSFTG